MHDLDRTIELQRRLAYRWARTAIECEAIFQREAGHAWLSLTPAEIEEVQEEIDYLRALGKLSFHRENTDERIWFRVRPLETA